MSTKPIIVGSGLVADRDALDAKDLPIHGLFVYTNGDVDQWSGTQWVSISTNGAKHARPIPGTGETTKDRYNNPDAIYAESTNSCTWTAKENVTEIYITIFGDAATTTDSHGWVVFDAIDSAAAVTLLGATVGPAVGPAVDVQKKPLKYGERNGPFNGVDYFTRLDVGLTGDAVMFVEAQ